MKEADIQRQIVEYLQLKGWMVAETSQKGFSFATRGLPDVVAVKASRMKAFMPFGEIDACYARTIWIEVKGPRGKQREDQVEFQRQLELQGGEYLLANALEVVMEYLA